MKQGFTLLKELLSDHFKIDFNFLSLSKINFGFVSPQFFYIINYLNTTAINLISLLFTNGPYDLNRSNTTEYFTACPVLAPIFSGDSCKTVTTLLNSASNFSSFFASCFLRSSSCFKLEELASTANFEGIRKLRP